MNLDQLGNECSLVSTRKQLLPSLRNIFEFGIDHSLPVDCEFTLGNPLSEFPGGFAKVFDVVCEDETWLSVTLRLHAKGREQDIMDGRDGEREDRRDRRGEKLRRGRRRETHLLGSVGCIRLLASWRVRELFRGSLNHQSRNVICYWW